MQKPLVLHIGVGKTATTLWQKKVFPRHGDIDYLGHPPRNTALSDRHQKVQQLTKALISLDALAFDASYWKQFYEREIQPHTAGDKTRILSEEWLSGTPVSLFRTDRALIAGRLRDVFGKCCILIVIRDQLSVVESIYEKHRFMVEQLYDWRRQDRLFTDDISFSAYIDLLMRTSEWGILSLYKYSGLINLYTSLFGRENVKVMLYEDFDGNKEHFCQEIADFLQINCKELLIKMPNSRLKMRISDIDQKILFLEKNKNIKNSILRFYIKFSLKKLLIKQKFLKHTNPYRDHYTEETRQKIHDFFKEDNHIIARRLGLNLNKYRYPL